MMEWMEISSAPKDGTEIILMKGDRVTSGSWEVISQTENHFDSNGNYICSEIIDHGSMWCSYDGGFCEDDEPTHWMPLPEPPACKQ